MTPREAFAECQYERLWITSGEEVDYRIVESGTEIVIAFQASNQKQDWNHNLDFAVVPYRWMAKEWHAHKGFVCAWKSVQDEVMDKVRAMMLAKPRPITVAGWSHGAALATLCYEDCVFTFPDATVEGHGFGTPRVLWGPCAINARFANFHRWNVRGDPVNMLPPWLFGYHHVGVSHVLGPISFINLASHTAAKIEEYLP